MQLSDSWQCWTGFEIVLELTAGLGTDDEHTSYNMPVPRGSYSANLSSIALLSSFLSYCAFPHIPVSYLFDLSRVNQS